MNNPLIIDCDPGHDDAMAILFAARHLRLIGLTTVFGNNSLENTTRNALKICALGRLEVPVAQGMATPMVATQAQIARIHGSTGLDGAQLPEPEREPIAQHAVHFLIEQASRHRGKLMLAPLGPLTNIAMALKLEPRLARWIQGISLMGGSTEGGNITAAAEFNIHCDPEAAAVVFASGVPIMMAGLNITRQAGIGQQHIDRLAAGGAVGRSFAGLLGFYLARTREIYRRDTASMHDPCAILPWVASGLIRHQPAHVQVELASPVSRGMTLCDLRPMRADSREANASVALEIDGLAAVDRVVETLLSYDR